MEEEEGKKLVGHLQEEIKMKSKIFLAFNIVLFGITNFVYAQNYEPLSGFSAFRNIASGGMGSVLNMLYQFMVGFAVLLSVIYIIAGGIQYMTTDAFTGKQKGRERITNALIGLLIALGSYAILYTINPDILRVNLRFQSVNIGQYGVGSNSGVNVGPGTGGSGTGTGVGTNLVAGENGTAIFTNIENGSSRNASARGTITIDGIAYEFVSGGFGNGYLPPGTYTVTMSHEENGPGQNEGRRTANGMVVYGSEGSSSGWSFDLNNAEDQRLGITRSELRIHPDGGNTGTNGCVGIQGDVARQEAFFSAMSNAVRNNGGSYTIRVGQ